MPAFNDQHAVVIVDKEATAADGRVAVQMVLSSKQYHMKSSNLKMVAVEVSQETPWYHWGASIRHQVALWLPNPWPLLPPTLR
eukprot:1540401-Karenia_brevis.AAC.1